jgi:AraC-like DNA-binding protein
VRADDRPVLNPGVWRDKFRLERVPPSAALAAYVQYHWVVEWDLDEPYDQRILTSPSVHLAFEAGRSWVWGVHTRPTTHHIEGRGFVWGVRFRPGAFRPLFGRPVAELTDRRVPVGSVFAADPAPVRAALAARRDAAPVEDLLLGALPDPDPMVEEVVAIVTAVAADPSITRVGTLAAAVGVGPRTLQRLFHSYVGAGPKWVIRQYRLLEAAGRSAAGDVTDWAAVALELGYSDQSHLVRDFTAAVGAPPARYARTGG